jgi:ribonuclease E
MMSAELLREDEQQEQAPRLESGPAADAPREGEGARRRRRRGGRGRGDRGPRENFATEGSPNDAIESGAAELESARAPVHESVEAEVRHASPHHEAREVEHEQHAPRHEPVTPSFTQSAPTPTPTPAPMLAPPAAFRSVSEHDEVVEESQSHRPNRKRHASDDAPAPQELQLVETSSGAPAAAPVEDDLPQRTKPRRRRAQAMDAEPLKLVETQPGTQPGQDGAQTP